MVLRKGDAAISEIERGIQMTATVPDAATIRNALQEAHSQFKDVAVDEAEPEPEAEPAPEPEPEPFVAEAPPAAISR